MSLQIYFVDYLENSQKIFFIVRVLFICNNYAYMPVFVYIPENVYVNNKQNVYKRPCNKRRRESQHLPIRPSCHSFVKQGIHTENNNKSTFDISWVELGCIPQKQFNTKVNQECHVIIPKQPATNLENLECHAIIPQQPATNSENLECHAIIPQQPATNSENLECHAIIPQQPATNSENLECHAIIPQQPATNSENLECHAIIPQQPATNSENLECHAIIPQQPATNSENLECHAIIPQQPATNSENLECHAIIPQQPATTSEYLEGSDIILQQPATTSEYLEGSDIILQQPATTSEYLEGSDIILQQPATTSEYLEGSDIILQQPATTSEYLEGSDIILQQPATTSEYLEGLGDILEDEPNCNSKQTSKNVEKIDENVSTTRTERKRKPYCKQHIFAREYNSLDILRRFFEKGNIHVMLRTCEEKNQETSKPDHIDHVDMYPFADLFRYRQLKLKHDLLIYYNTSSHPDSVRGTTWSKFSSEIYRLCTFAAYPQSSAKSPTLLAAQGFVYIGNGQDDKVLCFFCGLEKVNWSSDDDIEDVHRRMSPRCPRVTSGSGQLQQLVLSGATSAPREVDTTQAPLAYNDSFSNQNHSLPANVQTIPQDVPDSILRREHSSASVISRTRNEDGGITSTESNRVRESITANALPEILNQTLTQATTEPITQSRGDDSQTVSSTGNETREISTESTGITNPVTVPNNALILGRNPTYSELGIITERPKRQEYAHRSKRLETFTQWPRDHHLAPEDLAEAGFFYAGYGDCARCFFCGGGLRNWDDEDDVWVEHARWFPRCFYLRQKLGQEFIDVVQNLHLQYDQISVTQIRERLGHQSHFLNIDNESTLIRRDPAVESVIRLGFREADVIQIARLIKQEGDSMSAEGLIEKLEADGKQKVETLVIPSSPENTESDRELIRQLKERNNQIRQQIICKICLDRDVSVVFLPCGHLVSCADCSTAMRDCPICRSHVRGLARAVIT